ncbi:MAG: hypothetical protein NUW37_14855 [Planctomycetes bacterium]|nr:hypothetical protein [Planctomycetota bacterium]
MKIKSSIFGIVLVATLSISGYAIAGESPMPEKFGEESRALISSLREVESGLIGESRANVFFFGKIIGVAKYEIEEHRGAVPGDRDFASWTGYKIRSVANILMPNEAEVTATWDALVTHDLKIIRYSEERKSRLDADSSTESFSINRERGQYRVENVDTTAGIADSSTMTDVERGTILGDLDRVFAIIVALRGEPGKEYLFPLQAKSTGDWSSVKYEVFPEEDVPNLDGTRAIRVEFSKLKVSQTEGEDEERFYDVQARYWVKDGIVLEADVQEGVVKEIFTEDDADELSEPAESISEEDLLSLSDPTYPVIGYFKAYSLGDADILRAVFDFEGFADRIVRRDPRFAQVPEAARAGVRDDVASRMEQDMVAKVDGSSMGDPFQSSMYSVFGPELFEVSEPDSEGVVELHFLERFSGGGGPFAGHFFVKKTDDKWRIVGIGR